MTHAPPGAVAARDLPRQAGERHPGVGEVRIARRPQPGVHAAHRRAHHQPQVVRPAGLRSPGGTPPRPCRRSHSAGSAPRRPSLGLLEAPWPMSSGRMTKYFATSSGWPGPNSSPAKLSARNCAPLPVGAVHDQHGIAHDAGGVLPRRAERAVVHPELGQRFARGEPEVPEHDVALSRPPDAPAAGKSAPARRPAPPTSPTMGPLLEVETED